MLDAGAGATYVATDAGAKGELVSYLQGQRDQASVAALGPTGGVIAGGMAIKGWFDSYEPPDPDEYFSDIGLGGSASATASGLVLGAQAEVSGATAVGSRVDVSSGSVTVYYEVALDGSASAGYDDGLGYATASAEGQTSGTVAVTINSEGDPITLSATATRAGEYNAQAWELFADQPPQGPADSSGQTYTATLDLDDSDSVTIGTDALQALGILPSGNPYGRYGDGCEAYQALVAAAKDHGLLTMQDIAFDSSTDVAIQGGLGAVAEVGAGFSQGDTTIASRSAWYWSDGDWKDWAACS